MNKTLEQLTLMDRFLFAEAMQDQEFAETVYGILFDGTPVLKGSPVAECEIRNMALMKYIKLDVWAEDQRGDILDIEVQNENSGDIPKRSRYYQSTIDANQLKSGQTYSDLKDVKIIFIADFDLFGQKKYCYTFNMRCKEADGVELNDGGERIFFNIKGTDPENISNELRWMLCYFKETTKEIAEQSGSERIMMMHSKIEEIKSNGDFSFRYWADMQERAQEIRKARETALEMGKIEVAKKLKALSVPIEKIAEATGLSIEEIEKL